MRKIWLLVAGFAVLTVMGTVLAAPAGGGLTLPVGYRQWFHVNTSIVTKDSPDFVQLGGQHNIYINSVGLPALKKGGPYPDGSVFTDDIHEVSLVTGAYVEGNRKAVAVMVKNAKKYAATGGWGFQLWAGGDPTKPIVADAVTMCFSCHTMQKDHDFVFSTYLP
jgi:hypothetical protein